MKRIVLLLSLLFTAPAFAGKCTVSEYVNLPRDGAGQLLYIATLSSTTLSQQVSYTTSNRISTALVSSTNYIRVYCDTEARLKIGDNTAAAVAGDTGMPAGATEYFFVPQSTSARYLAVYDGTS